MSVINTNVKSMVAQNALTVNNRALSTAMERLSTGRRINSASDDAAGLAISNRMTAQIRGLNMAVRNANDAISMLQTTEGSLNEVSNMLQRMRELAVQSANATNSATDRSYLNDEVVELQGEIRRIAANTQWNSMNITSASGISAALISNAQFQVGANSGQTITVSFQAITGLSGVATAAFSATLSIGTISAANSALASLDIAISAIDSYRSTLGAKINRLEYAADNLANISTNSSASRSRILDADYAVETTELARTQIIQQAATAMLAQANQQPAAVLSLLK